MSKNSSRDKTQYLKGIAISMVLVHHYLGDFFPSIQVSGFADGGIALFFLVSGFGIYHSLERRFKDNKYSIKAAALGQK